MRSSPVSLDILIRTGHDDSLQTGPLTEKAVPRVPRILHALSPFVDKCVE